MYCMLVTTVFYILVLCISPRSLLASCPSSRLPIIVSILTTLTCLLLAFLTSNLSKVQSRFGTEFPGVQAHHGTMIFSGPHHYMLRSLVYYLSYLPLGFAITLTGIT